MRPLGYSTRQVYRNCGWHTRISNTLWPYAGYRKCPIIQVFSASTLASFTYAFAKPPTARAPKGGLALVLCLKGERGKLCE
jgi:hypothetical protein